MRSTHLKKVEPSIPSDLVSVAEAAEISGMTRRTVWKKIRSGQLRAWGVRRCYRISLSELLAPVPVRGEAHEHATYRRALRAISKLGQVSV